MTATTPTDFAFGANVAEGCQCPAMVAGFDPAATGEQYISGLAQMVGTYDHIASMQVDNRTHTDGVFHEEIAQEVWLSALEQLAENPNDNEAAIEAGERVAQEIGWLDDE